MTNDQIPKREADAVDNATAESFMTVTNTARKLNVSERKVRRMIWTGVLEAYRIGTAIRVSPAQLKAMLDRAGSSD